MSYLGRIHLSFLGCQVYFAAFILFLMDNPVCKHCRPYQMTHYVASDLGLHCLPMTLLGASGNNRLKNMLLGWGVRMQLKMSFNPFLTSGLIHPYHLYESISSIRDSW